MAGGAAGGMQGHEWGPAGLFTFFKAHIMSCSRPTGTTDCHVVPSRLFLMPRSFAVASLLSAKFPSFTIAEELALGAQVKQWGKKEWFVLKYSKSQFDPY